MWGGSTGSRDLLDLSSCCLSDNPGYRVSHTRVFILFRFDTANCVPVSWRQFGSFVYLIINSVTYMTTVSTYTGCPTRYRTRHVFNNFTVSQQIVARQAHTTDTFLFISHTTNVPLFKFHCNILIGVRIIDEMPAWVASGTPCTCAGSLEDYVVCVCILHSWNYHTTLFSHQCHACNS
jgi:hypothetical protein